MASMFIVSIILIIPGLALMFAPTAFLWGVVYSLFYWLAFRFVGTLGAAMSALVLTPAVLWLIPQHSITATEAELEKYALPAVKAQGLIQPAGDIRIDEQFGGWEIKCGSRCLSLLFEPKVRSVTINRTETRTWEQLRAGSTLQTARAKTFRLRKAGQCGDDWREPDDTLLGYYGRNHKDNLAISTDFKRRLTTDACLAEEEPMERHDMLLRQARWHSEGPPNSSAWTFSPQNVRVTLEEIRAGTGEILFRTVNISSLGLFAPLNIGPDGGLANPHFGWERTQMTTKDSSAESDVQGAVDDALAVRRSVDKARVLEETRLTISAALDNPAFPETAIIFEAVEGYLSQLNRLTVSERDLQLVQRLIRDPRFSDLPGAYHLPNLFGSDDLNALRPDIARKLASPAPAIQPGPTNLGTALENWPEASFATLLPDEAALLQDARLRPRANGLIVRLSDGGAPAAGLLTTILDEHLALYSGFDRSKLRQRENQREYEAHRATMEAAVKGLCRMGPAASGQLHRLLKIEDRLPFKAFDRMDWDRMMARVGKPLEAIRKPESLGGSDEKYRDNLRRAVRRPSSEIRC
ncbi:hypothetical protein [Sphingosinicella microcystinivorans]|nr:hypothetical protein [Sphingosinicella microcystinivorans]